MNNAYVAVLDDGSMRWNLKDGYDGLATKLRERNESISVSYLALKDYASGLINKSFCNRLWR